MKRSQKTWMTRRDKRKRLRFVASVRIWHDYTGRSGHTWDDDFEIVSRDESGRVHFRRRPGVDPR